MDYAELGRILDGRLESLISRERAAHSRRVARLVAELCAREGLDSERGRVAGLAHDLCKELPRKVQRELAASYPGLGATSDLMADKIVHGPAAAALLARDYGVGDQELLEAIAIHTVGRPGMSGLSVILYCADKLEPGREREGEARRSALLALPLDAMLLGVIEDVLEWMGRQGKTVAPETLILYSTLVREADPR
jgi:nicotinate-nucleotide adenylyltransferase